MQAKNIAMKRILLFTSIVLIILFSCKNQGDNSMDAKDINVEHALQNLTRLRISDFGKTIRYIPLETTDEGLVGNNPTVKVLKDHIVIEFSTPKSCLLFSKKDGRFIASIGRVGQGPHEYSENFSWTDEKEEFLYFARRPDQLIKFDMKGVFCGKVEFSSPPGLASFYLLTESEIVGYFSGFNQTNQFALAIFDKDGVMKDTVPLLLPIIQPEFDQVAGIQVTRGISTYGNWARSGAIVFDYKDDTRHIFVTNARRIWKNKENIRFKENYIDTLYTLSDNKLIPSLIFHTGKYHLPVEDITGEKKTNERIFIADVSENDNFVFFQCIKGLLSDDPVLYNGLYHKKTGATKLGKYSDAIEDDVNHFMPFIPLGMSTSGEFVSLLEAGQIMEWLETHPEAKNNDKLTFLKTLNEEMNPVVVLVE